MAVRVAKLVLRGVFGIPIFWVKGGCSGSVMVLFKRAMVVSYRLSVIVTIALSLTVRPHLPSNASYAQINGVDHIVEKFGEKG